MIVSNPTQEASTFYRCDVCGRNGFWRSVGFSWSFYGGWEGDGLHFCSEECRVKVPDLQAAFKRMFTIEKRWDGDWPCRKHEGLIGDKPKRSPRECVEDRFSPTESYIRVVCPACRHENAPPEHDPLKVGGQIVACQGCQSSLHVNVELLYLASVERVSHEWMKSKLASPQGAEA